MDRTPPEQLLLEKLKQLNVKKVDLARRIAGPKANWLLVHRWTQGRGFNKENRRRAAQALGLPLHFFDTADAENEAVSAAKEAYRRKMFEEFCATDLGKKASEAELRILNDMRFADDILPSQHSYSAHLLALQHRLSPEEVKAVIEKNRALLESAKSKGRRPTK
jgi:hypothetical protein